MSTRKSYSNEPKILESVASGFCTVNASSPFTNSFPRYLLNNVLNYTNSPRHNNGGGSTVGDDLSAKMSSRANYEYLSQIENDILRSTVPIELDNSATDEITVNGQRGIWANKSEVLNWRGTMPIEQYLINQDQHPEIIIKSSRLNIEYIQELAIRYLRPPTPPRPGDIIISQEANTQAQPAPPLVIRQQPARPATPEPLVFREIPPKPPVQLGRKIIAISGKRLPPPPRKVVIERLAALPSKPQGVMIERWLPYNQVKRRVIFQKSNVPDPVVLKTRNVIIQWEAPNVSIKKEVKYLGVIRANPAEYVQRYKNTLKSARDMPQFVLDIKQPQGIVLAADYKYYGVHELEGAVSALNLIDLEKEGLAQYRSQVASARSSSGSTYASSSDRGSSNNNNNYNERIANLKLINDIFSQVDFDGSASITRNEASSLLYKLSGRLRRPYSEIETENFLNAIDIKRDGKISLQGFKREFERLL